MINQGGTLGFVNPGSNLVGNIALGEISLGFHPAREGAQKSSKRTSVAEATRFHAVEKTNRVSRAMKIATEALEDAKKKQSNPVMFALALECCTLQFWPNACNKREDQSGLQALNEELQALRTQVRARLTGNEHEELQKAVRAVRLFKPLSRYIVMRKCWDEYQEIDKRLGAELAGLREQKAKTPKKLFRPSSWKAAKELEQALEEKESQVEDYHRKGPFEALNGGDQFTGQLVKEQGSDETSTVSQILLDFSDSDHKLDRVFQKLPFKLNARDRLDLEFRELALTFEARDYSKAVHYRTELLGEVMRCYKLASVQEAEALLKSEPAPERS